VKRHRHITAVLFLIVSIFASIHFAQAQQAKKIPRIGFLAGTKPAAVAARVAAFQQGLREMGYVEGKNIVVEYPYAGERGSRA
jgi:putative tryptophan/tyrosine transport system substrate-binding protein